MRIEYPVERFFLDVAEHQSEILADRHVAVWVDHQLAEDGVTPQAQVAGPPLAIESHEVIVFLSVVYVGRNGGCVIDG